MPGSPGPGMAETGAEDQGSPEGSAPRESPGVGGAALQGRRHVRNRRIRAAIFYPLTFCLFVGGIISFPLLLLLTRRPQTWGATGEVACAPVSRGTVPTRAFVHAP